MKPPTTPFRDTKRQDRRNQSDDRRDGHEQKPKAVPQADAMQALEAALLAKLPSSAPSVSIANAAQLPESKADNMETASNLNPSRASITRTVDHDNRVTRGGSSSSHLHTVKPSDASKASHKKLPRGARCSLCKTKLRKESCGTICQRKRPDGSLGGCGSGICWNCMESAENAKFGRIRTSSRELASIGCDAWWMHELCMEGADSIDYSVQRLPVPVDEDLGTSTASPSSALAKTALNQEVPAGLRRELPAGWKMQKSKSTGQMYYLERGTLKTQWHPPTESIANCSSSSSASARGEAAKLGDMPKPDRSTSAAELHDMPKPDRFTSQVTTEQRDSFTAFLVKDVRSRKSPSRQLQDSDSTRVADLDSCHQKSDIAVCKTAVKTMPTPQSEPDTNKKNETSTSGTCEQKVRDDNAATNTTDREITNNFTKEKESQRHQKKQKERENEKKMLKAARKCNVEADKALKDKSKDKRKCEDKGQQGAKTVKKASGDINRKTTKHVKKQQRTLVDELYTKAAADKGDTASLELEEIASSDHEQTDDSSARLQTLRAAALEAVAEARMMRSQAETDTVPVQQARAHGNKKLSANNVSKKVPEEQAARGRNRMASADQSRVTEGTAQPSRSPRRGTAASESHSIVEPKRKVLLRTRVDIEAKASKQSEGPTQEHIATSRGRPRNALFSAAVRSLSAEQVAPSKCKTLPLLD